MPAASPKAERAPDRLAEGAAASRSAPVLEPGNWRLRYRYTYVTRSSTAAVDANYSVLSVRMHTHSPAERLHGRMLLLLPPHFCLFFFIYNLCFEGASRCSSRSQSDGRSFSPLCPSRSLALPRLGPPITADIVGDHPLIALTSSSSFLGQRTCCAGQNLETDSKETVRMSSSSWCARLGC